MNRFYLNRLLIFGTKFELIKRGLIRTKQKLTIMILFVVVASFHHHKHHHHRHRIYVIDRNNTMDSIGGTMMKMETKNALLSKIIKIHNTFSMNAIGKKGCSCLQWWTSVIYSEKLLVTKPDFSPRSNLIKSVCQCV